MSRSGGLAADAAGALRTVLGGGTVVEEVAKHWNDGGGTCPHCKAAPESVEHRLWQRPCWDGARTAASKTRGVAGLRTGLGPGLARAG
eukprot:11219233-Lingulodinium_polyedra.AAC.1